VTAEGLNYRPRFSARKLRNARSRFLVSQSKTIFITGSIMNRKYRGLDLKWNL